MIGLYFDIGTQSTLWMLADRRHEQVFPIARGYWTNGFGMSTLPDGSIPEATMQLELQRIVSCCSKNQSPELTGLIVGTAALRNAPNGEEFLRMISAQTGLESRLLSPDSEASTAWAGANSRASGNPPQLLIDLGGGSTEAIWLLEHDGLEKRSLPIGAALLSRQLTQDPPGVELYDFVSHRVESLLDAHWNGVPRNVVPHIAGGTSTTLGALALQMTRYDPNLVSNQLLTLDDVSDWCLRLSQLNEAQRSQLPGMPPGRAGVLPAGVSLLMCLMTRFEWSAFQPEDRGVLFGLPYFVNA